MTEIIGVFHSPAAAERYGGTLTRAGYQFKAVSSLPQLLSYLDGHECVVLVIGPKVPANEKLRIFGYVKRWSRRCDIIEIYESEPELTGCVHVRDEEGEPAILRAIEQVTKAA